MRRVELCAPAGTIASLRAAVDSGADAVYLGFPGATNARNFPGLNFDFEELKGGLSYVRRKGRRVFLTVNSYPQPHQLEEAYKAIDAGCALGVDALILTDLALLDYTVRHHEGMRIHLSVQAGASSAHAIEFYRRNFGVKRVVLPRVLNISQIRKIRENTDVELEVFAAGILCINYEGRCQLSSYITGESNNSYGACSHPRFVRFEEEGEKVRHYLGEFLINSCEEGERMAYPTPCKGRYIDEFTGRGRYSLQEPESLNALEILPELVEAGVDALKIEGRQRSASYVRRITSVYRKALDVLGKGDHDTFRRLLTSWNEEIRPLFEGCGFTVGSYKGGLS